MSESDHSYDTARLNRVEANIQVLQNRINPNAPALEIISPRFMARHTSYASFDAWLITYGISTKEGWDKLPIQELDTLVSTTTHFPTWEAMLTAAYDEWRQGEAEEASLQETHIDTD